MEEKKLTDEEVVKALEHCATENTCRGCVKYNGATTIDYFKCMRDTRKKVVDLFRRLQAENAEGKARIKELTRIAEYQQQSNIERWAIIQEKDKEIKRLTEEKDKYQKKWHTAYMNELDLQRQVDELKVYLPSEKVGSKQAVKDTAKEILTEIGESDILVVDTQEYGEIEVVSMERLKEIVKRKGVEVEG